MTTRRSLTTLDKLKIMVRQAICPDCGEKLGALDDCEIFWRLSAADGRARKSLTLKQKLHVLAQQARCPECGELLGVLSSIQYDHRHQLAMGGPDTLENIRAVHIDCHAKKTARDAAARAKVKRITGKTKTRDKADRFKPLPTGVDVYETEPNASVRRAKHQWPSRKLQSRNDLRRAKT